MPQITIYLTATCNYCEVLKKYFSEKNLTFTEKYIDQDFAARDEMEKLNNGYLAVPFIYVKTTTGEQKIIGFDRGKLDSIFK